MVRMDGGGATDGQGLSHSRAADEDAPGRDRPHRRARAKARFCRGQEPTHYRGGRSFDHTAPARASSASGVVMVGAERALPAARPRLRYRVRSPPAMAATHRERSHLTVSFAAPRDFCPLWSPHVSVTID